MTVLSTPPRKKEYSAYASTDVPAHIISVMPVRSGRSKENSYIKSSRRSQRLLFEFDSIRFTYDIDTVELTRGVDFMCGCINGLTRPLTVLYGLVILTKECVDQPRQDINQLSI